MIPIKDIDPMDERYWHVLPAPSWAIGLAEGVEVGAQLPTKDGRRVGNSHVVGYSHVSYRGITEWVWHIVTDAGNTMKLTHAEVEELFHPPTYVSDLETLIQRVTK